LYVNLQNPVKVAFGGGFQLANMRNTCAIDEYINASPAVDHRANRLRQLLLVGDIAGKCRGIASFRHDLTDHLRERLLIDVYEKYAGTPHGKKFGDGLANSASCSGNDCDFFLEIEHAQI